MSEDKPDKHNTIPFSAIFPITVRGERIEVCFDVSRCYCVDIPGPNTIITTCVIKTQKPYKVFSGAAIKAEQDQHKPAVGIRKSLKRALKLYYDDRYPSEYECEVCGMPLPNELGVPKFGNIYREARAALQKAADEYWNRSCNDPHHGKVISPEMAARLTGCAENNDD